MKFLSVHKQFTGLPLPYAEAVKQRVIEVHVADLVEALNIDGICGTRASCAGHGWSWISHEVPFVYMVCDMQWSLRLAQTVESLTLSKKLNYCWILHGQHVSNIGLCWNLRISDSRLNRSRKKVNQDFANLACAVRLLATEFKQGIVLGDEAVGEEQHDKKNYKIGKPFGVVDFSQGIGI